MRDKLGRFVKGHPKPKNAYKFPKGERSRNYKNGEYKCHGYVYILKPKHPRVNEKGYIQRSHFIMEQMIGRYLTLEEVVHHKGTKYPIDSIENRQDDRPENLKLFDNESKHQKFHQPPQRFKKGCIPWNKRII